MSDRSYPNSGLLFRNFKKKQPKHPDFTGNCEINGVKLEMSAWEKPLRNGKGTFLSISFQPPRAPSSGGMPVEGEAETEQKVQDMIDKANDKAEQDVPEGVPGHPNDREDDIPF